jgi:hypothetical protein
MGQILRNYCMTAGVDFVRQLRATCGLYTSGNDFSSFINNKKLLHSLVDYRDG